MPDQPVAVDTPTEDNHDATRHPADYMHGGMRAYTAEEFAYVEQQHEEANR